MCVCVCVESQDHAEYPTGVVLRPDCSVPLEQTSSIRGRLSFLRQVVHGIFGVQTSSGRWSCRAVVC